jgi:hypothetical protein
MVRVLGIGGIFFKSPDPAKLYARYRDDLVFPAGEDGVAFTADNLPPGSFSIFGAAARGGAIKAPNVKRLYSGQPIIKPSVSYSNA